MFHPEDDKQKIIDTVTKVLRKALTLPSCAGRTGAYFYMLNSNYRMDMIWEPILHVPEDRAVRWRSLSKEKGVRLLHHPDDRTSRQSADPTKEQYGGAAVCPHPDRNYILSLSGLPRAADDEAVILAMMWHLNWNRDELCFIAAEDAKVFEAFEFLIQEPC